MSLGQCFGERYNKKNKIKPLKQIEKFGSLWQ
jgi:hypothetical protein